MIFIKKKIEYLPIILVQKKIAVGKFLSKNWKLTFHELMYSYIHYFLLLDQAVHSLHPKVSAAPSGNAEQPKQSKIYECKQ